MGKYFNYIDFYNNQSNDQLTIIPYFKTYLQSTKSTCGPACILMLMRYYGDDSMNEMQIAEEVGCKIPGGVDIRAICNFFVKKNYKVDSSIYKKRDENGKIFSTYLAFKDFVLTCLRKQQPILVENVDLGGHYKIIIGIDQVDPNDSRQDVLIYADPAQTTSGNYDGYFYESAYRFYMSWFDFKHLPMEDKIQPYIIIELKNNKSN